MLLVINRCGNIRCLYNEAIEVQDLGQLLIRRASYVEPDTHGEWHVDFKPLNGPQLGPYRSRQSALQAEESWLETHWLTTLAVAER
jgi:hypothetical protein